MSTEQLKFVLSFDWLQLANCVAYDFGCEDGELLRSLNPKLGFGYDKDRSLVDNGNALSDRLCYDNVLLGCHDLDKESYASLMQKMTHETFELAILHEPEFLNTREELFRLVDSRAEKIIVETKDRSLLFRYLPNRTNHLIGLDVYLAMRKA